ncbi:MAG: flippase-like domain-containing protein [Limnochordaceae bacterium]|nr:flippase-like domain-containing protein [Limnochordaceae bacterium]
MRRRTGSRVRARFLLAVALLASFFLLLSGRGELGQTWQVLRTARVVDLGVALALQALFFVDEAWLYRLLYQRLAQEAQALPWASMLHLTLASTLLNRLFPAAGLPLFLAEGRRHGIPTPISTAVNVLFYLLDYLTFLILAMAALAYFFWQGTLNLVDVIGTVLLGVLVAGVAALGWILVRRPERVQVWAQRLDGWGRARGWTFTWILTIAERLTDALHSVEEALRAGTPLRATTGRASGITTGPEPAVVGTTGAAGMLVSHEQATASHLHRRSLAVQVGTAAALIQVIDVAMVWVLFHAFTPQPPRLAVVAAGYALASALSLVSFIPSGLGVFEVSMTVVYHAAGVALPLASAVTLTYRVLSLWLPIPAGWPSLHWLARQAEVETP